MMLQAIRRWVMGWFRDYGEPRPIPPAMEAAVEQLEARVARLETVAEVRAREELQRRLERQRNIVTRRRPADNPEYGERE